MVRLAEVRKAPYPFEIQEPDPAAAAKSGAATSDPWTLSAGGTARAIPSERSVFKNRCNRLRGKRLARALYVCYRTQQP